jgi:hypothetical protein
MALQQLLENHFSGNVSELQEFLNAPQQAGSTPTDAPVAP